MSAEIALNPDVICSPLDDGGVLLDLETKQYFALNHSGLFVWQHLEDGGSLATLRQLLAATSDTGLAGFVNTLVGHGLAHRIQDESSSSQAAAASGLPTPWTAPTVTPHGRPLSQVILSPFDPTVPIPE